MSLPADYHMHTALCQHATGNPSEYAAAALSAGLGEIGFSDHSPMAQDGFDNWRMRLADLGTYVDEVLEARRKFPQLIIRLALEVDYLPGHEPWIRNLATRYPWDYFIGSVHYVTDTWVVDNPAELAKWKNQSPEEVWSAYVDRLTQAAASGLFEIIGHVDLPKKFGHRIPDDLARLFEPFCRAAKQAGVAVELNTGGLRKECQEIYPSEAILRAARAHDLPITFGSDAHAAEEVGVNLAEAVGLAREAGYTETLRFEARHKTVIPLG